MNVEQLLMGSAVMMATQQRCILQLCLSTRFPWNYMVSLAPSGRNRASRDNATTVTSMECSTNCPWKKPLRSEEHTSELQSRFDLVCRLLLEKKKASLQ